MEACGGLRLPLCCCAKWSVSPLCEAQVSKGACSFRRHGPAVGTPLPVAHRCTPVQPPPLLPGEAPLPAVEECEAQAPLLVTAYPELVDLRLPDPALLPASAKWTGAQHAAVLSDGQHVTWPLRIGGAKVAPQLAAMSAWGTGLRARAALRMPEERPSRSNPSGTASGAAVSLCQSRPSCAARSTLRTGRATTRHLTLVERRFRPSTAATPHG